MNPMAHSQDCTRPCWTLFFPFVYHSIHSPVFSNCLCRNKAFLEISLILPTLPAFSSPNPKPNQALLCRVVLCLGNNEGKTQRCCARLRLSNKPSFSRLLYLFGAGWFPSLPFPSLLPPFLPFPFSLPFASLFFHFGGKKK